MTDRVHTRGIRGARVLFVFALAFVVAAPLKAAELVAVRVGDHPTFTRVVFEFDVPGGYRIERNAADEAANVVRVTLDAASEGRRVESRSPGVASVSVEAGNPRSIARIAAREPSWPIKEMILADPPRVVLDFLRPEPVAAPEPDAPAELAAAASAEPSPPADERPDPPIPSPPAIDPPIRERALAETIPEAVPDESLPVVDVPTPEPGVALPEPVEAMPGEASPRTEGITAKAAADPSAPEEATESDLAASDLVTDRVVPEPATAQAPKEATVSGDSTSSIPGGTPGLIAAGVLALLALGFVLVRRGRARDEDIDVTSLFPDEGSADDRPVPKEGFNRGAPPGNAPALIDEVAAAPVETIPDSPGAAPGIFDDALEEKEAMTMDNTDLTIGSADSEAATQLGVEASMAGTGGSNIVRIIQDMESRIAHLEARLDESVDARQQLERQVSAQTEELRVQRAAIARTQRALRSLNRTDEEQATEPALRNPEKPPASQ